MVRLNPFSRNQPQDPFQELRVRYLAEERENKRLQNENERLKRDFTRRDRDLYECQIRCEQIESGKEAEVDRIRRELHNTRQTIESTTRRMQEEKNQATGQLKYDYERTIQHINATHSKELDAREKEYMQAMEAEQARYQTLSQNLESETRRLTKEWTEDRTVLKANIEKQNILLFKRENFAPVPDRLLNDKFTSLERDVQSLANQNWENDKDNRLWTEDVMTVLATSSERLRADLLQDNIWWILHEHIFCSPFRMFGKEGRVLEKQWIEAFGQDAALTIGGYTWPTPSLSAERWRYEAIKASQIALKDKLSKHDPRAKLKLGYIESRAKLLEELRRAVAEFADLDSSIEMDIEKLIKKGMTMWLEFGNQRCRLMVIMPVEKIDPEDEKVRRAMDKSLVLTSMPGLIRYGDENGQDLHRGRQTVGKCVEVPLAVS